MESLPRISVVIVTYNFAKYLRECIESILAQTLRPFEIVIYDDCSTDESWSIITEYKQKYPELFVIHCQPENVGMRVNANVALQRARGDLVSCLDGDDRWSPRKLELEWAAIRRNPEARVAYSNVRTVDAEGRKTAIWYDGKGPEPPSGDVFIQVFSKRFFPGIRSIFRNPLLYRSALVEMDYHDDNVELYIDWDLKVRLSAAYPVAYSGEVLVDYRIHSGGIHNQPVNTHLRDLVTIYRQNLPLLAKRTAEEISLVESELDSLSREYGAASLSQASAAHSCAESVDRHIDDSKASQSRSDARSKPLSTPAGLGENLIFLVSLPRSGSTLLQRVLANHPDVHTTAEPWVMLHPLYALKRQGVDAEYESDLARRALDEFLEATPNGDETYIDALRAMASVLYGNALEPTGKRFFLDKTPRYFYILPELIRVFPKARFVLLSRNPAAVLSSVLRTWLGNDIQALQKDQHYVDLVKGPELLSQAIGVLGDAAVTVHYEDLVGNPGDTVRRVCEHVGIPFQPAMLDYGRTPAPNGTFGDPRSVHRHNTVVGDYLEMWRSHLSDERFRDFAVKYIDSLGSSVFETLGYSSDATRRVVCGERLEDASIRMDKSQVSGLSSPGDLRVNAAAFADEASQGQAAGVTPHRLEEAVLLNKEGEAAFNDGNMDLAEVRFKRAHELVPDNIEVLNNLVVLNWQKQDLAATLTCLADALELDPTNRNIVVNAGQILTALNNESDAGIIYSSFLERNPGDEEVERLLSALTRDDNGSESGIGSPGPSVETGISGESEGKLPVRFADYAVGGEAPRISIVIPSFNQGNFLEETICSVLEQEYPNLELIVMDGGSTDRSIEIIKKYEASISYWESGPDRGQYWAVDTGLRRASGDIMTWINSDDKLHPNSLNAVASVFTQLKEVDWLTGTPSIMNEKGELTWVCSTPPVFSRKYYLAKKYDFPSYIQQEGTFWRRSLWEKAGARLKTSLKMAGDLELWMRFFRHSRLYTTDMLLGCFRQHDGQKTASKLDLYRKEALRELNKEAARFKKSNQVLPEKAPVITITDVAKSSRDSVHSANENEVSKGGGDGVLITAIVSTYNSEKYIEGCLQDLMSQTIADRLEVIVVDSGSQQNERAVVERYQEKYRNIRYFRTDERETIYSAWNKAVQEARGEFVSNANTDDRHRRDAYEKMAEILQSKPDVALVYADSIVTNSANTTFENAPVKAKFQWPEFDARLLFSVCYIGPQPMWRRSLHEKYGYFDPQMKVAGDYDFWLRMAGNERFHHLAEELGLYLQSSGSVEHAYASDGVRESEVARQRNWPVKWGQRPVPGGSYLVPVTESNNRGHEQRDPTPLVSVVMPTKNRLDLLGRALDSVIAQTYRHWELIVVNDGGEDVAPVVDSRASGGRIRCLTLEQSVGQAAARNIAFQEARGKIICYLDDDDLYLAHHLETVVRVLSHEERPFVYTDAVLVPERHNNGIPQEVGERSNPYEHDEYSRDRLLVGNYIPINTWAHWKTCLDEVGVFDESLNCYEDWELLLRLSARYEFAHVRQTTVEVMFRVDRVDNVTRQRLADTTNAYKAIYQRHADSLSEVLVYEREMKLQALEYAAEQRLKAAQGASGTPVDDGSPGLVSDEHRLQYLSERFLRRVEESDYVLPSIHLIMLADENDAEKIAGTLDSLSHQVYAGWGLSVISTAPPPHQDFDALPMLEWVQSEDVGRSFLEAARQSECDWIASVMPGDTLEPEALSVFVDYINQNPGWKFIYSDEDCVDVSNSQVNHKFKPDINPDYLYSCPYTGNLSLVHRDLLSRISGDVSVPAALFYDLVLKVLDSHGVSAIGHIPTLLYHQLLENECREERETWVKPVLEAFVRRNNIDARVLSGLASGTCMIDYRCSGTPGVCIAIHVGSDLAKAERTVSSLVNKTAYSNWTIRLGVDREFAPQLDKFQSERLLFDPLEKNAGRCAYFDHLARTVDADYMVFMDSGVVVLQDNWLDRLLAQGQRQDVGVVGIRLLSPQNKIAHAGILTGIGSFGVGGCIGEGDTIEQQGYMQRSQVVQNLSAVSSACMLIKRSLYQSMLGFDTGIAVQLYRDVDFCLRVRETGKRIVWTPFVTMLISDDRLDTYTGDDGIARVKRDSRRITSTWLATLAKDPAYNRNLSLKNADFSTETDLKPVWDPAIRDLPRMTGCGAGSFVSWAYRVAQPLDALSAAGRAGYSHVAFKGQTMDPLPSVVEMERIQPDVLLLQNTLHDHCLESLQQYRKMNNLFMVLGQDDLMFAIPPKSSGFKKGYKDIKKRLRTCLSMMDRLVVTGEPLADELSGFINDIRIVPNYLDARMWGALASRRGCGAKPRVGWAGAMQHLGDLEILADAVRETADEVDWIFMGMCPNFLRPYVKEVHEYVAFNAYPEALAKLNLDLAVAPLERNRFNRCKSNLRILEYGAMGWPVIATDIEPYWNAPVHLVSNQTRAWINAIREHVHDLDAAWKAGDTLQKWVRENCLLQQHLDDWVDALDPGDGSRRQSLLPDKVSGL